MQGGHQIINSNLAGRTGTKRKDAKWIKSDKAVRQLLLRVFPKLETDEKQRERAGRWSRVIHLFYRLGMSYRDVAAEMNEKTSVVRCLLRSVRRAASGQSCNRSGRIRKRTEDRTSLGCS